MRLIDVDELFDRLNGFYQHDKDLFSAYNHSYIEHILDGIKTSEIIIDDLAKHDSELLDKFVARLEDYFVIPHDVYVIERMAKEMKAEVTENE